MKRILYYITDHGRGHATRTIAIVRELQKLDIDITIRNSNVIDFLHKSLPSTPIISGKTDVGTTIKKDGISIDEIKTKQSISNWIKKLENFSELEQDTISKTKPNLIISDISAMPFLAAKKANISSLAISNFSWYDVLKFLTEKELDVLINAYDHADMAIQLPLGTQMNHFRRRRKTGFVCRLLTENKKQIKNEIGIKDNELSVFFELGKSNNEILCDCNENIKIISTGTKIKNDRNVIRLPEYIEGQNLVAASDLVICKCGYGIISECITNGIPFLYIMDENHVEQKAISDELQKRGYQNHITLKELNSIQLNNKFILSRTIIKKEKNDIHTVIKLIQEILYS